VSPHLQRPKVVIVGAGFGGLCAARGLAGTPVDVTLIDRRNFHLFQPLLYQVATAGLNPSDIAWPVRSILRRKANARVLVGEVVGVDVASREVLIDDGRRLPYDWLVIATGTTHTYFGNDQWAPIAPGLKRVDDATLIRRRILMAFERAENAEDETERQRLMTFVIIGAGPTGVELAGAIAELARKALAADFRAIDPRKARIVLIEGTDRVLGTFQPELSRFAKAALERMDVEVQLGKRVTACDTGGVIASGERLPAGTSLWAAGGAASPAAKWLGAPADRARRVEVRPDLTGPRHPHIFVIGRNAALIRDGKPLPGIAPGGEAGRRLRRQSDPRRGARPSETAAVPLPALRCLGDDWPQLRRDRLRAPTHERAAGLVDLEHDAHLFSDRRAQPSAGHVAVAARLHHVQPRRAVDRRLRSCRGTALRLGRRRLRGLPSGRQRRRERPWRPIQSGAGAQSEIEQH